MPQTLFLGLPLPPKPFLPAHNAFLSWRGNLNTYDGKRYRIASAPGASGDYRECPALPAWRWRGHPCRQSWRRRRACRIGPYPVARLGLLCLDRHIAACRDDPGTCSPRHRRQRVHKYLRRLAPRCRHAGLFARPARARAPWRRRRLPAWPVYFALLQ